MTKLNLCLRETLIKQLSSLNKFKKFADKFERFLINFKALKDLPIWIQLVLSTNYTRLYSNTKKNKMELSTVVMDYRLLKSTDPVSKVLAFSRKSFFTYEVKNFQISKVQTFTHSKLKNLTASSDAYCCGSYLKVDWCIINTSDGHYKKHM